MNFKSDKTKTRIPGFCVSRCTAILLAFAASPGGRLVAGEITPLPNPPITHGCGLDVVLVLDVSGSIDPINDLPDVKAAAHAFVNHLIPSTPSEIALVVFSANAGILHPLSDNPSDLNNAVDSINSTSGQTNWQDALFVARGILEGVDDRDDGEHPDLIVMLTDGQPNLPGKDAVNSAITEANLAKSSDDSDPIRVVAVGIALGTPPNPDFLSNLVSITGPLVHGPTPISKDIDVILSDFDELPRLLSEFVSNLCEPCKLLDDDDDGVNNCDDQCPNTAAGAQVDENGCSCAQLPPQQNSPDSDEDGVPDVCDHCPNTPAGQFVDDDGCSCDQVQQQKNPLDEDQDGVPDACDQCPDTPPDTPVDPDGCSCAQVQGGQGLSDNDRDGVPDICDVCPATLGGPVDANGCNCEQAMQQDDALDGDNDGVPDACDLCEGTPAGEPVDADGCSCDQAKDRVGAHDNDRDGVPDACDLCPATLGGPVDENGCNCSQALQQEDPLDGDGDGVPDACDLCEETAPGVPVDSVGCSCAQINPVGKNLDQDGDGVADLCDACPGTPTGETVDAIGCSCSQRDGDGDGVNECIDRCSESSPGADVNAQGCSCSDLEGDEDCNQNDVRDECEIDCNANGLPDDCDISSGTSADCNENGVPDECEIATGTEAPGGPFFCTTNCAEDCNANGLPDECDANSDDDGLPDDCDNCPGVFNPDQADADDDGVGDLCEEPTPLPPGCVLDSSLLFGVLSGAPVPVDCSEDLGAGEGLVLPWCGLGILSPMAVMSLMHLGRVFGGKGGRYRKRPRDA